MTTPNIENLLNNASWEKAKLASLTLGNCNNVLTQTTKILEKLPNESESLSATCYFLMRSLLAAHSVRAKFLYAIQTLDTEAAERFTTKEIIAKLLPKEHSAISAGIFAYHIAKKICLEEHLPEIDKDIQEYGEVGMICGHIIPKIGAGKGLIIGMIRPLSFATFSKINPANFTQYRLTLKKNRTQYNLSLEEELFGCQHSQVASLIVQKLGFTRDFAQDLYLALASSIKNVQGNAKTLRTLSTIIDSIMAGTELPNEDEMDFQDLGHTREDLIQELKIASRIKDTGSLHAWMSRAERDVNPSNSPDLYEDETKPLFEDDFDFKSIPDSVRQTFSFEDFASLRAAVQDVLA